MMSLLLLALSCRTKFPTDDSGPPVGPGDTWPDTAAEDSPVDSADSAPVQEQPFELPISCPYEDPPTVFTGGLVWVHSLQPYDGAYSFELEGYIVARESGEVDWDAGTLTSTREHIPGYTAISSVSTTTFVLQPNGDSTSSSTAETTFADGTVRSSSSTGAKTGCVGTTEVTDPDTGERTLNTWELVSPTQRDWVEEHLHADGSTLLAMSWGSITSDWTDTYRFEKYDPNTTREVDHEGSCTKLGDGHRSCDTTVWSEDGYLLNLIEWQPDGDSTATWETWETESAVNPTPYGIDAVDYDSSGTRTWTFWDKTSSVYVACSGSWDTARQGTWSCDNGASGTWEEKG